MRDYTRLIRKQLLNGSEWLEKDDQEYVEGVERQFEKYPEERIAMVEACKKLLFDPDLMVRSGIVSLLDEFAKDLDASWLFDQFKKHNHLFEGLEADSATIQHGTLDKDIIVSIASALQAKDKEAIAYIREIAYDKELGRWVILELARADKAWFLEHVKDIVPHRMVSVLIELTQEERKQVVQALAPWPEADFNRIPASYWEYYYSPDEAQEIQTLMKG